MWVLLTDSMLADWMVREMAMNESNETEVVSCILLPENVQFQVANKKEFKLTFALCDDEGC